MYAICGKVNGTWLLTTSIMLQNPFIGELLSAYRSICRDEVVFSRLKLGHSYLTHSYLLKAKSPPECVTCNCRLTISHILVDCIEYNVFRLILFEIFLH